MSSRPAWCADLDVLDRIESELAPDEHAVLHRLLRRVEIEPDAWLDVAAVEQVFTMMAVLGLVERFELQGLTREEALHEVESTLGVPAKTIGSRLYRWAKAAASSVLQSEVRRKPESGERVA